MVTHIVFISGVLKRGPMAFKVPHDFTLLQFMYVHNIFIVFSYNVEPLGGTLLVIINRCSEVVESFASRANC